MFTIKITAISLILASVALLVTTIVLILQFVLLYIVHKLYKQQRQMYNVSQLLPKTVQEGEAGNGKKDDEEKTNSEGDENSSCGKSNTAEGGTTPSEVPSVVKTRKQQVLDAILKRHEITEEELPRVKEELTDYFSRYANHDYSKDLTSEDYCRFIDLREKSSARVVVVGDIHCDYYSLTSILLKLSVSSYDYFENAFFVFLGDYLDRGYALFEPLLLLKDLQNILGNRLIMLKGNHESLSYDSERQQITTRVRPNQSCECLNKYCGRNHEFLLQFASFYSTLPIYVYLKTTDKNILLTHAAIPRDKFLDSFYLDGATGHIVFEADVPITKQLGVRNAILKDMVWGDPKNCEEKIQTDGRFEFGSKQFEHFASYNHIDMLIRSHEEVPMGFTSFFGNRLFTIFSSGGKNNPQTCYPSVEPAFAVIHNRDYIIENSFLYHIRSGGMDTFANLFSNYAFTDRQIEDFNLNEEFVCEETTRHEIKTKLKIIRSSFAE